MVLQNIQKEKEEEKLIVDIWCHFGHAYITKVGEGEWNMFVWTYCSPKRQRFVSISMDKQVEGLVFVE